MNNYVYQFILEPQDNGRFGLIFSEESEDFHSPVFAISVDTIEFLHDSYIFPGEIDNEYSEFKLISKAESFILKDERFGYDLQFFTFPYLLDEYFYRIRNMKTPFPYYYPFYNYIGKYKNLFRIDERFQIIVPSNLMMMDRLFFEKGLCLVGYTPTFNNDQNSDFMQ